MFARHCISCEQVRTVRLTPGEERGVAERAGDAVGDVQQAVLLRTREKLETLERTVATLEAQLADKPAQS